MPENGTSPTPVADDALARVLQPLLEGSLVLTDRDGFVTRWTPRAKAMFGFEGDRVTGHSLLETIGSSVQQTPTGGVVETGVRHEAGQEFPVELTFIPVPMSHSLEFNFFLESLESDRPREAVLRRVQSQHSEVLDWISSVVAGVKDADNGDEMTAGTIVTFRAKVETPWADLAANVPSEQDNRPRPVQPNSELSSAVAHAEEMIARSDALERNVGEATAAVEEARTKADAAHETAAAAASRVADLDDENSALRGDLDGARNELAELRRMLEARAGQLAPEALEMLREEIARMQAAAPAARPEELVAVREELERLRTEGGAASSQEVAALRRELEKVREQAATGEFEQLGELKKELKQLRKAAREDSGDHRQLERLRAELDELRAQPSVADPTEELAELRRELRELRSAPVVDGIDLAGLKQELRSLRESAPESGADSLELAHLRREVEALRSRVPGSEDLAKLRQELEQLRAASTAGDVSAVGTEELESLREELAAARAEAVQVAERLRELESTGSVARGAGYDAGSVEVAQVLAETRELAAAMQAQVDEAKSAAAEADAARRDADAAKRGADSADQRAEAAAQAVRRHLAETREGVESASLKLKLARAQAEAARASADDAARYAEAAREIGEALANQVEEVQAEEVQAEEADATPAPLLGKKDSGPIREPIPGFDDAGQPMARIAIDGRFKELNDRFTELVGYSETDFQVASWPPVADRRQLDHHREQMRALLEGKLDSAEINTGYVHAQGLLVPIAGTLSLVRDDDGEPSYFLLAVLPPPRAAAA